MMKKFYLLLLLGVFASAQKIHLTSDHNIKGKIFVNKKLFYDQKEYKFEIDKNKPFIKKVPVSDCVFVFMSFGARNFFGFVGPNTNLKIHFLKNKTIVAKEDVVNAFSNEFHTMFFKKMQNDKKSFIANMDKIAQEQFEKLEKIKNKISLNAYKVLKASLVGRFFLFKVEKAKNDKNRSKKMYEEIFQNGKFPEKFFNYSDNFNVAIHVFFKILKEKDIHFLQKSYVQKIQILNKYVKNKRFISAVLVMFGKSQIEKGDEKNKKLILEKVKKIIDKEAYMFLKRLKANSSKEAKVGDTFKFLEFDCIKPLGKNSLAKNKFLYVDNWATWCLPCVESIKNSLKNKIKIPENVQMVYISFDRTKEKVLHFIKKLTFPKGTIHFWNKGGAQSEYAKNYNIMGLPRYILIDKQGKIKDLNPPKPHSKDFEKYLQNLK